MMIGAAEHESAKPKLLSGARMRYDEVRKRYVLLLPERAVLLSDTAAEILQLCDGGRTVTELVGALEEKYPGAALRADVVEFLDEAVARRWVQWTPPA
jgi:pyrroloquinoline quinone biosynthesis protein D